jgi:hypothetical protein
MCPRFHPPFERYRVLSAVWGTRPEVHRMLLMNLLRVCSVLRLLYVKFCSHIQTFNFRFEILTAFIIKTTPFLARKPCHLVDIHQLFGTTYSVSVHGTRSLNMLAEAAGSSETLVTIHLTASTVYTV